MFALAALAAIPAIMAAMKNILRISRLSFPIVRILRRGRPGLPPTRAHASGARCNLCWTDLTTATSGHPHFVYRRRPSPPASFLTAGMGVPPKTCHVASHGSMWLENAVFTKLGAGVHALNPAFFRAGVKALDGNDYIVYNRTTGALSYDNDGNGAHVAIAFATLTNKPALAANDFVVI
jgi:hypothetical protein